MKDISDLRLLTRPATLKQVKVALVLLSIGSAYGVYAFGAPWGMSAFMAVFWMLPLFGMNSVMRHIRLAVEAYDGNRSVGTNVKWIEYPESEGSSYGAEFDLGAQGKWLIHLHRCDAPYATGKKDMPAVITVWLHPETSEPRLLKAESGYFYADKVERLLQ